MKTGPRIPNIPRIVCAETDSAFRDAAQELAIDPDSPWVGGYVDYEWRHGRIAFEALPGGVSSKRVLEFGCNYGASSIVLAVLGAEVTAVDVDPNCVRLATLNGARYGCGERIRFVHVPDTSHLPFGDATFDLVTCNSVLEYVPNHLLPAVQKDIDRVLRPGGLIAILGTSNRLWPREVHSRRWLSNYLPRGWETLWRREELQRGLFPWHLRSGFGKGYENLDLTDGGRAYLDTRLQMHASGPKRLALTIGQRIAAIFGTSIGLFTPSIAVVLRKQ